MNLLLIGCGKMGGALLQRWRAIAQVCVIDPHVADGYATLEEFPAADAPDVIVFAVKPQQLANILPAYRARFGTKPLYLSVAAGKTLAFYAAHLGGEAHVVRVMPNTPALIGQGMSVLCASAGLPESAKRIAIQLLEAVGQVTWLENEAQMDAVTAISGCGPAYVFLFLDALVKAGIEAGLPENMAKTLTLHTLSGSAALAGHSGESFSQLIRNVASPGGSTEAALKILRQDDGFEKLIRNAVMAAARRSRELAE